MRSYTLHSSPPKLLSCSQVRRVECKTSALVSTASSLVVALKKYALLMLLF